MFTDSGLVHAKADLSTFTNKWQPRVATFILLGLIALVSADANAQQMQNYTLESSSFAFTGDGLKKSLTANDGSVEMPVFPPVPLTCVNDPKCREQDKLNYTLESSSFAFTGDELKKSLTANDGSVEMPVFPPVPPTCVNDPKCREQDKQYKSLQKLRGLDPSTSSDLGLGRLRDALRK